MMKLRMYLRRMMQLPMYDEAADVQEKNDEEQVVDVLTKPLVSCKV